MAAFSMDLRKRVLGTGMREWGGGGGGQYG